MATSFTTHSASQVIASADINLIQTAVNALENAGGSLFLPAPFPTGVASSSSNAFKGFLFTPSRNMTISAFYFAGPSSSTAASYQVKVCTLTSNAPGSTTVASVVGASDVVAQVSLVNSQVYPPLTLPCTTPVVLVSGTTYAIMAGCTTGGGTFALNHFPALANAASEAAGYVPGTLGANVVCAVAGPVATSSVTVSAATSIRLLVGFSAA